MPTTDVANAETFRRAGVPATALTAAHLRDEFANWLARFFDLDADRASDLILAVNEALANCAEFAYRNAAAPGTMDLLASYEVDNTTIAVLVIDRGTWRHPDSPRSASRGRGIPLMKALSDDSSIESTDDGTHVRLEWANVPAAS